MKTNTTQIQSEREGYADRRRRGVFSKASRRVIWKSKSRHVA